MPRLELTLDELIRLGRALYAYEESLQDGLVIAEGNEEEHGLATELRVRVWKLVRSYDSNGHGR